MECFRMRLLSRNIYYNTTSTLSRITTGSNTSRSSSSTSSSTNSNEKTNLVQDELVGVEGSSSSATTASKVEVDETPRITTTQSASAYLAAQAELEELEESLSQSSSSSTEQERKKKKKVTRLPELEEEPWTGDEPQDRAIRRILEDSYKPLRVKGYKKPLPILEPLPSSLFLSPNTTPPPVDSPKIQYPWQVKYKAPDSYRPISRSQIYLQSNYISSPTSNSDGNNKINPKRLARAVERSRDYEAGLSSSNGIRLDSGSGTNEATEKRGSLIPEGYEFDHSPTSHSSSESSTSSTTKPEKKRGALVPEGYDEEINKQWRAKSVAGRSTGRTGGGFVEQKIEEAIRKGLFRNIEGRGKPIKRDEEEGNPYIRRDEFLINRIVKSQGAAPPWVDLQGELEIAINSFRIDLRDSWKRRAIRVLSEGGVSRTSITQIETGWRDPEWEAREKSYHEAAIKSINGIVRRYNGVAPYSVRRTPSSLAVELKACFEASAPSIERELLKRMSGAPEKLPVAREKVDREIKGKEGGEEIKAVEDSIWRSLRNVVGEAFGVKK